MDDLIIYDETLEGHFNTLVEVFNICRKKHLKLNIKKCEILREQVIYLGHLISAEGIQPNPEKIEIVMTHPVPKSKKQLQSFLGLVNYYSRHCRNLAEIAQPLFRLIKKNVRFIWSEECEQAFRSLIKCLVSKPILSFPNFKKKFFRYRYE